MGSTAPNAPNILHDDPHTLFQITYRSFSDALPNDIQNEFADLKSPAEMFARFQQLVDDKKSSSVRIHRIMKGPAKFGEALNPYFEVINIYVQSNPEYAALVWGSLRFIFLVAKNYTTFLEKVEKVLLRMVNTLPNFELFLQEISRKGEMLPDEVLSGLIRALAWIYHDILVFCHRLCTILQPQQKGFMSKVKLLSQMAFKPFDAHFAEILENFQTHAQFFNNLRETTSAIVALQLYERWKDQTKKTEASLQQMKEQQIEHENAQNTTAMSIAISELQRRVGSPAWATTFEHVRSHRVGDTCEWLLSHPLVVDQMNHQTPGAHNVLIMYGKPGYGKTTLATALIDHLKESTNSRRHCDEDPFAFYFFDRQSRYSSSHHAWRAILAQLIFSRRFDQIVLDIAALARSDHDTGHQEASDDEVFAILHLFLLQFRNCTLVFDGVDECTNRDDFLTKLSGLTANYADCNSFLFSRPTITIPKALQRRSNYLQMDDTQNLHDIISFVHPQIADLVENEELVLPKTSSIEDIAMSISNRSNGMFLWAVLFLGYLKLPSLSLAQKRDVLEDESKFEGLHSLYESILAYINNEYPRLSRRNIRRTISWVLGAIRPLTVSELQVAVAQMSDRPIDDADFIPNFERSIGAMTGALIEITKDKTVRLIHITVAEYLMSVSKDIEPGFVDETVLDFKPAVVQHYITKTCLAYLTHTIPIGPYADKYTPGSDFASVCTEHPLLSYTVRFWTEHLRRATTQLARSACKDWACHLDEIGQSSLAFLSNKARFTSWTEALWHLQCPPEAWAMESIVWQDLPLVSLESPIRSAASMLHLAFEEFVALEIDWSVLLSKCPEELWLPSISAFSTSRLRKVSAAAETASVLGESKDYDSEIVLQTKCSMSGHAIGILKARCRPNITEYAWYSKAPADFCPITVVYVIRSLSDDTIIFETSIDVPSMDIIMVGAGSGSRSSVFKHKGDAFSIETSISPTLMEVMVGCTLLKLAVEVGPLGPRFECAKHVPPFFRDSSGFKRTSSSSSTWKLFLSPGAEYLLLLQGDSERKGRTAAYTVNIFQDPMCRRSPLEPKFTWVAWKNFKPKPNISDRRRENLHDKALENGDVEQTNPSAQEPMIVEHTHDSKRPRLLMVDTDLAGGPKTAHAFAGVENGSNYSISQIPSSLNDLLDINNDDIPSPSANYDSFGPGTPDLPSPLKLDTPTLDSQLSVHFPEPVLYFHPNLPQIVYTYGSGTYLWNFCSLLHSTIHEVNQDDIQIYASVLRDIRIADSGNLLYGFETVNGKERVAFLNLSQYQKVFGRPNVAAKLPKTLKGTRSIAQHLKQVTKVDVLREASSQAQPSNTAMLVLESPDKPALSILRRSQVDGSLVQEMLDAQGTSTTRTLLELPQSISKDVDVTLLRPGESGDEHGAKRLKVLLGVPHKRSYSFGNSDSAKKEQTTLPIMFSRDKGSIKAVEGEGMRILQDSVMCLDASESTLGGQSNVTGKQASMMGNSHRETTEESFGSMKSPAKRNYYQAFPL